MDMRKRRITQNLLRLVRSGQLEVIPVEEALAAVLNETWGLVSRSLQELGPVRQEEFKLHLDSLVAKIHRDEARSRAYQQADSAKQLELKRKAIARAAEQMGLDGAGQFLECCAVLEEMLPQVSSSALIGMRRSA